MRLNLVNKRKVLAVVAIACVIIAAGALFLTNRRTPRYQGKTIGYWWQEYTSSQMIFRNRRAKLTPADMQRSFTQRANAVEAFSKMGSGAAEFLIDRISPSPFAVRLFGLYDKLPAQVKGNLDWVASMDPRLGGNEARNLFFETDMKLGALTPHVLRLLADPTIDRGAALTLFNLLVMRYENFPASADDLGPLLRLPEEPIVSWAAAKLAAVGPPARRFAPDLRSAIRDHRLKASVGINALLSFGEPVWSSLPALGEELSNSKEFPALAYDCFTRLTANKDLLMPAVSNMLHHPDVRYVATALGKFPSFAPEARPLAPALMQALESPWYFMRSESARALDSIGGPELLAAESRLRALAQDSNVDVSNRVAHALRTIEEMRTQPANAPALSAGTAK